MFEFLKEKISFVFDIIENKTTDEAWRLRFIAHIVKHKSSQKDYALSVVDCYLLERHRYESPEEAAQSDIEHWGH